MSNILNYLKISVVIISILIGIQVPAFVDQYGKSLDSRLAESENSIAEFQDDADKYFDGDLDKLIKHYENKEDPVIVSGGESIETLVSRNKILVNAQVKYQESFYSSYIHVLFSPIKEIREDVWRNYTYSIVLNKVEIIASVISGVGTLMLIDLLIFLLSLLTKVIKNPSKRDTEHTSYF